MNDPIVDEIRAVRQKLYLECNGDIDRMLAILRDESHLVKRDAVNTDASPLSQIAPTQKNEPTKLIPEFAI